ncbi:DUF6298 domain-containing protein [Paenibacillus lignilyticus]|uniref:DUF6298 domain-containing protein n=1 Tax=Paenibacillus lignilyticus TaxID=1172615 RepID=A0ABS5CES0_9BACL|nr:DUF6298 domain-containing protein [Paenibacillus lignilyticus]MBP3963883.1 hypothetical protein [Paenibacillus lignilyticus]
MTITIMANGVLRKSERNPRYFENGSGNIILLTGSHTWANLQELRLEGEPAFDYEEYLTMMTENNHNFMRLWQWGHPLYAPWTLDKVYIDPMPYMRTGDQAAHDGLPQFDLTKWNEMYFARMRERVVQAGERGIYVSVMFFDGWCPKNARAGSDPWLSHPYNRANNVNGIHGDSGGDGRTDMYSMEIPSVVELQQAFIRKCIDTLNDLDHVLFEIINEVENSERALKWHSHMIQYVHDYESKLPKQHPVGMTAIGGEQDNSILFASGADWISPGKGPNREYQMNPPAGDGSKVIITDTDHLWGHGGNYHWVWKSFLRGLNPIFMDSWCPVPGSPLPDYPGNVKLNSRDYPDWEPLRRNMGHIRQYADRIGLEHTVPNEEIASSRYCLVSPMNGMLVYAEHAQETLTIDLSEAPGSWQAEWFDPVSGAAHTAASVLGGSKVDFAIPFAGGTVLYLFQERGT